MRRLYSFLAILALYCSGWASLASADILYTPALPAVTFPSGDSFSCNIVNTTGAAISVTTRIYDQAGTLLTTHTESIAKRSQGGTSVNPTYLNSYYCKFTVPNKGDVRAAGLMLDVSNAPTGRIEAVVQAQ